MLVVASWECFSLSLCVISWILFPWTFGSLKHLWVCINFIRRYIRSYTNWLYHTKSQSFFSLCKGTLHVHLSKHWPPLHPLVEILAAGHHKPQELQLLVSTGLMDVGWNNFISKEGGNKAAWPGQWPCNWSKRWRVFPSRAMERLASLGSPCAFLRLMIRAKWTMDSQIIWFLFFRSFGSWRDVKRGGSSSTFVLVFFGKIWENKPFKKVRTKWIRSEKIKKLPCRARLHIALAWSPCKIARHLPLPRTSFYLPWCPRPKSSCYLPGVINMGHFYGKNQIRFVLCLSFQKGTLLKFHSFLCEGSTH
jgi:hypothetical protein